MVIDTHCHLLDERFDADREAVIARARAAGVDRIVVVGENEAENRRILEAAKDHPVLWPAAGHEPSCLDPAMAERTATFIREHRAVLCAVGEVGVDHRITEDPAEHAVQDAILETMAGAAKEANLPLSVHSRAAGRHAIEVLRGTSAQRVILHAFDGKFGTAMAGLDAGYYFSIPPSIVRSRQKQKLARALPLDRILLESDAPVLGPDPAARNEPANVRLAAAAVAALKRLPLESVFEAVAANAQAVFRRGAGTACTPANRADYSP